MIFNKLKKNIISAIVMLTNEKIVTLVNIISTILASFFISFGFFSFYFSNQLIDFLKQRLDFSIYFKPSVTKEDIIKVKKILQEFPGVKEIEYITQEMAFEKFKKETQFNNIIVKALEELKTNPLMDYLIVKSDNPEVYLQISEYLTKSPYKNLIDYISYFENQKIIKRIYNLNLQIKLVIIGVIIFIIIFCFFIIFNTTLTTINLKKEEIEILRLIGAENWYIRMTYFFYITFYSLIGYLIFLLFLILFLIKTENFWINLIPNFNPSYFFKENFFILNFSFFAIILIINYLSTFISLEKYLKK